MSRTRKPLRRWAALALLLLWLFGIGTGVAHACMAPHLQAQGPQGLDSEALVPAPGAAGDRATDPAPCHGAGQAHGDPGAQVKSNCQDFCEKASVSIPPLKSALDAVLGAALLFPAPAGMVPVPAPAPIQHAVPRRDGALAPPISIAIAFLRLTL